ncbi:hypothetical protein DL238_04720 [Alteriqipengyuania lutimaris]|uniref:Uncharacterized protein n=1 Tax=Alteriqipengyuania lutimaris TaxID=1538146 RepID=A0A395LNA6_9SPHN|nr:hypothetical protein DL238_04720 [Alteriqipengyuania lutimaris]
MTFRKCTILLAALALAACASGSGSRARTVIDRALASVPPSAQPSEVVAREIAFGQAARERGQYTAALDFATGDAMLHGRNGPVLARPVFSQLDNPETAAKWSPRTVMMSCDGRLAVSRGRFLDADGMIGTYVTVWQRDSLDDEYEWSYDVAGLDDPQPVAEEAEESLIVVTASDDIQGLVADCPRSGDTPAPPPALAPAADASRGVTLSRDGTLRWLWEHREDGTKYVRADYYTSGAWEMVIEEELASPPE